jgi:hypothetical protein
MVKMSCVLGLLVCLAACSKEEGPPPFPDADTSPPPSPVMLAPASAGALTPLPALPPPAPPARTAAPRSTASPATPQISTTIPIPFTPYRIPIPTVLPIPIPAVLPTALPIPAFPFPTATPTSTAPPTATTPPISPPAASQDRVIVFGTTWCGPCKSLQKDLQARGVPFTFVNVEDPEAMKTPAGARAAEIPPDKRGAIPLTRVVLKNGAIDWVSGANGQRIEQGYRG